MLPTIPTPEAYDVSSLNGFLPDELPLEVLPDSYYNKWESVVRNLQALILSRRLRGVVDALPILSTDHLRTEAEWRRAYVILAFISHSYIWGGDKPAEIVPPSVSIPFLATSRHLELPTVATYAGVVLWNFKPIFDDEHIDNLENLATLLTFTGSLDESWFYLVSVAIEARGAPTIPLMLSAFESARRGDARSVTAALQSFAERLDELGTLLLRMYENCDPHVFYHRIRPFLAGSKNMAEAGLPNGVKFEDGTGTQPFVQYSGGSNAQSSIIQFFDLALGIEHRPTGEKAASALTTAASGPPPPTHNFIKDMRQYMPGPHRRFLEDVASVANIRAFVDAHRSDKALCLAFDGCLAMLRALRDKHLQMVSRYIIVKSRESASRALSPQKTQSQRPVNLATSKPRNDDGGKKQLRGTGGTALISFLKQARDESGEPAVGNWARRLLTNSPGNGGGWASLGGVDERKTGKMEIVGMAGIWSVDDSEGGGICHW